MSIIIDGKECYGIIYKIENTITHEIYIGQTSNSKGFDGRYSFSGKDIERVYAYLNGNKERNERHNQHLRRSIEKYGFDAFKVNKMLDVALTREELNEKETYYIEKFDCFKHGYNQTYGGDNFPRGEYCKNSKRICQISLDGELIKIWDSATDAHNELGICAASISQVCSGHITPSGKGKKTAGGFVWAFEKDYDPYKNYSQTHCKKDMGRGTKPVLLLSDDGDIIQEFYSVISAGKSLGISPQEVSRICLHKAKTIRFNLIYKSEYIEEQRLNEKGYAEAV